MAIGCDPANPVRMCQLRASLVEPIEPSLKGSMIMRDERSMLRILGGVLFGLLLALALPAHASHKQECEDDATCVFNQNPVTNTATTGAITNTNTTTGGSSSVGNVTGGTSSVGDVTGGSVGDIDNDSSSSVGDVSGGAGGTGGNVNIDYPDQPVSSPAMAIGGICSSGASVSTKDIGISIGTGDQLCRHMELIRMGLFLKKDDDVKQLWEEALAMERRGSWFRRCPLTGWITGLPIIGRLF